MARIIVGGNNVAPGSQSPNQIIQTGDSGGGKKLGKFLSYYYKIPITIAIAFVFYLVIRTIIPSENIIWWAVEIWAFVISLLVLWGLSEITKAKSKIGFSVFLFILVMFILFVIKGYNEHHVQEMSTRNVSAISIPVSIPVLGPGTHIFFLKNIGDETGFFQFPEGDIYYYQISSDDYGYKIFFMDDPTNPFPGNPSLVLPDKEHAIINIVATKANQYVRVTVK